MLERVAMFLAEMMELQSDAQRDEFLTMCVTLVIATPKTEVGGVRNLQRVYIIVQ